MTNNDKVSDNNEKKRAEPSRRHQFRLPLSQAIVVESEIDNEFDGSVTRYYKDVLKNRHLYRKHKEKRVKELFDWLEASELTIKDVKDSPRWREFVERSVHT